MNQETLDLRVARDARDTGIAKTRSKNSAWLERALEMLPRARSVYPEVTGEFLRLWLLKQGLPAPTSPNAWGALTRTAMKRGLLRDTNRVTQMCTEKSHARRTPIWEVL